MANTLYNITREKFGLGLFDILGDYSAGPPYTTGLKVALVSSAYTPDFDNDEFFSDLTGVTISSDVLEGNSGATPATFLLGILDADDITITGVPATSIESLVIYSDDGTPATSRLICYIDVAAGTLPVTPTATVTIEWNASGILRI